MQAQKNLFNIQTLYIEQVLVTVSEPQGWIEKKEMTVVLQHYRQFNIVLKWSLLCQKRAWNNYFAAEDMQWAKLKYILSILLFVVKVFAYFTSRILLPILLKILLPKFMKTYSNLCTIHTPIVPVDCVHKIACMEDDLHVPCCSSYLW